MNNPIGKFFRKDVKKMSTETMWEGKIGPFTISRYGTLTLTVRDDNGKKFTKVIEMDRQVEINYAAMFYFKNAYGMRDGIGVVAGWRD